MNGSLFLTATLHATAPPASSCGALGSENIAVRAAGGDVDRLLDELSLRLSCPVTAGRPTTASAELDATVDGDGYRIELALPDGRVFRESGPTPPELDDERVVASGVATLVASIERGERTEDERRAPASDAATDTGTTAAPPDPVPPPNEDVDDPPPSSETETGTWNLGLAIALAPTFAAGPPDYADNYLGFGGEFAFVAASPKALRVFGGVRLTGRAVDTYGIFRARFAAGVGGGRTWTRLHVWGVAGPVVEPLAVTETGGPAKLQRNGDGVPPVLLGGFGRIMATYRFQPRGSGPRDPQVAIGPVLDLQLSAMPVDGGTVAGLRSPSGEPIARAGGLEISWGLTLELRWPLAR